METGYRIVMVKHYSSLDAAKKFFLQEIPDARQDYHRKVIEDYAVRQGAKAAKGKEKNAKSK